MRTDEAYDQGDLLLYHICEVCNKVELLTSKEGFYLGWDYPPRLGVFGIISPRTCADCEVENTLVSGRSSQYTNRAAQPQVSTDHATNFRRTGKYVTMR